jgi:hypothetical protein
VGRTFLSGMIGVTILIAEKFVPRPEVAAFYIFILSFSEGSHDFGDIML